MYEKENIDACSKMISQIKVLKHRSENSPHKFILLLSLIDLFDNNENHENEFYFTEIEPVFLEYFNLYYFDYADYRKMLEHPFYYLKNDGFWNLYIKEGKEEQFQSYEKLRLTKKRIIETVEYAYLSDEKYQLFRDPKQRQLLKKEIISILPGQYEVDEQIEQLIQESSLFEHEQIAIDRIGKAIVKMGLGRMLSNILIYDPQSNNYYEYDLILIGHSKIYVVDLKHWSGMIQIAPYNWKIHGTQYRPDPHKNNGFKCKILKGLYQHQFRTYPNIWVESIVVLTNPDADVEGADSPSNAIKKDKNNLSFSSIEDFLKYIKNSENAENHILNKTQIDNIADYIQALNQPPQGKKYTISGYETVEYLTQRSDSIELLARPIGPKARGLNRFRVFRAPANLRENEKEVLERRAFNTLNAVAKLKEHQNILKVWLVPNDEGNIIEGSDWSEIGTLRDFINNEGKLDIDEANRICYGIMQGLAAAHQNEIIHRAVKPENILLQNGIPKLMNFDLAYQIEEDRITVISDIEDLIDDGYIAPEVISGHDIDETTDLFALGIIAYELYTGSPPFKKVRKFIADGGILNQADLDRLRDENIPEETIEILASLIQANRLDRVKDANQILKVFAANDQTEIAPAEPTAINAYLNPGDTYDMYEIIELIGEGKEAQIYKAKNARQETVAIKLFNKEIERNRIFREGDITSSIKSSYVVGCNNVVGHWDKDRYFLVLDYIEGEPIRTWIDQQKQPDLDTFRSVATGLLQGLQAFHKNIDDADREPTILHSDIKPDNILLTKDGKAVIIDFGIAGVPRIDVFQGTMAYIPPDSLVGADMKFSEDGDLYALGITLWEWLCGKRPYDLVAGEKGPDINLACLDILPSNLRNCLIKSIALERENRFHNIDDMIEAFSGYTLPVTEDVPDDIEQNEKDTDVPTIEDDNFKNPFVSYLNTLSNASAGNENATAESQILNDLFANIRVEHPITQYVYDLLFEEKRNVILTGNAGDGKTTIAAEIYKHHFGNYKPLLKREESPDLVLIKDLSELPQEERLEIFNDAKKDSNRPYLIVSNTGTLIENLGKNEGGEDIEHSHLLMALEADRPCLVDKDRFLIVNIGRINSIDAALSVSKKMLEKKNWEICSKCNRINDCPIYTNVSLIQESLELILERIGLAYKRLYEYGNRLTMRQMTGHLAYLITGDLNCEDVFAMSKVALKEQLTHYLFFNRFFGDDGEKEVPEAMQLLPVRRIREAELGAYLDPFIERSIWRKGNEIMQFPSTASKVLDFILADGESSTYIERIQVRRMLYFLLSLENKVFSRYLTGFLQSPMLLTYLKHVEENKPFTKTQEDRHLRVLLQVLQESFAGIRLLEDEYRAQDLYITLKPPGHSNTQMVLSKAHYEDFSLGMKNVYDTGTVKHQILTMRYRVDKAELELDLPFLDYVARRYRGEVAEELSVFYMDRLQRFKIELLDKIGTKQENDYMELLNVSGKHNLGIIKVKIDNDTLEVIM